MGHFMSLRAIFNLVFRTIGPNGGARKRQSRCQFCIQGDAEILSGILHQSIPDSALGSDCCWRRICQVRGRNLDAVSDRTWHQICTARGRSLSL